MNGHLQNKSEINIDAAGLLHKNAYYSSVAHCSYYACYQIMKHIWLHKLHKSENDLEVLCQANSREGSHEVLINQIIKHIKSSPSRNNINDSRVMNSDLLQLKKLRIKADYKDELFDSKHSSDSISLSRNIISILKKY